MGMKHKKGWINLKKNIKKSKKHWIASALPRKDEENFE